MKPAPGQVWCTELGTLLVIDEYRGDGFWGFSVNETGTCFFELTTEHIIENYFYIGEL